MTGMEQAFPLKALHRSSPLVVLLLSLLVLFAGLSRLSVFRYVYSFNETSILAPDSASYLNTARAFLQCGKLAVAPENPDIPQIRRTPVYPLFIAFVFWISDNEAYGSLIVLQILFSLGTIMVSYLIASELFNPPAALFSALFMTLELPSFVNSQQILTDTLFTFVLSCAILIGVWALKSHSRLSYHFNVFLLACATMIRPVSYYLIIPLTLFFIGNWKWTLEWSWKKIMKESTFLLIPWLLLVGGWQLRNYYVAETAEFSSIQGVNLLFYRGADVLAQREGITLKEAQERLGYGSYITLHPETADWSQAELYSRWKREGLKLLRRHPLLVLKTQFKGIVRILFGPGGGTLSQYINGTALASIETPLRRLSFAYLFLLYLCIITAVVCLGRTIPLKAPIFKTFLPQHIFLGIIAFYLLIVPAGPEAYSRFRIPLMPIFSLYAGLGGTRILLHVKNFFRLKA